MSQSVTKTLVLLDSIQMFGISILILVLGSFYRQAVNLKVYTGKLAICD